MEDWEKRYKETSEEVVNKLLKFNAKYENRTITSDELKTFKRLKMANDNLPKLKNIMQYRSVLVEELEKIKGEIERRKVEAESQKVKADSLKEEEKTEKELEDLMTEILYLEVQLKTVEKGSKEETELKDKLQQVHSKIDKNNEKFSKIQLGKEAFEQKDEKDEKSRYLRDKSDEELLAKKMGVSNKISKCNMICNNLLKGYSWDYIDMRLEKWKDRKFTSSKETANKARQAAKEISKEDLKPQVKEQKAQEVNEAPKTQENYVYEKDEELPATISEFDQKHPRLAAIKEMFKKAGQWIKNVVTKKQPDNAEKERGEKTQEPEKQEKSLNETTKKDDFRDYIKVVAEKGYKQATKEKLQEVKSKDNTKNDTRDEER